MIYPIVSLTKTNQKCNVIIVHTLATSKDCNVRTAELIQIVENIICKRNFIKEVLSIMHADQNVDSSLGIDDGSSTSAKILRDSGNLV